MAAASRIRLLAPCDFVVPCFADEDGVPWLPIAALGEPEAEPGLGPVRVGIGILLRPLETANER